MYVCMTEMNSSVRTGRIVVYIGFRTVVVLGIHWDLGMYSPWIRADHCVWKVVGNIKGSHLDWIDKCAGLYYAALKGCHESSFWSCSSAEYSHCQAVAWPGGTR